MAVGVIDFLEPVQVEHGQGQRLVMALGKSEFAGQPFEERAFVVAAR